MYIIIVYPDIDSMWRMEYDTCQSTTQYPSDRRTGSVNLVILPLLHSRSCRAVIYSVAVLCKEQGFPASTA